jgi:hypothetical protein
MMNERLKELKAQCWEERPYGPPWFNSDKFAKLIIRECADVCHTHGWGMFEHGIAGHNIADSCGDMIKEHFGEQE